MLKIEEHWLQGIRWSLMPEGVAGFRYSRIIPGLKQAADFAKVALVKVNQRPWPGPTPAASLLLCLLSSLALHAHQHLHWCLCAEVREACNDYPGFELALGSSCC